VNIWVGPAGGTSTCIFRGGTAAISPVSDTAKMNFIYVATYTGIEIAGNETLDASIWAYNKNWAGQGYGYVRNSGNPTVNGQILAHHAQINGNITINYVDAGIEHLGYLRYVFSGDWEELSGR
jgi:hypothetical protein